MITFPETMLDRKEGLLVYCVSVHGEDFQLAPGLKLKEFRSKCGQDQVIVQPTFLQMWAVLRNEAGPIVLTRGYSSWLHHRDSVYEGVPIEKVPKESLHLFGMAADCLPQNMTCEQFAELARKIGFGGVKHYPEKNGGKGMVHVDTGPKRTW